MKKIVISLTAMLSMLTANAIPLFPFFVDVAGDYETGTPLPLTELNIQCDYWQKPSFFSTLKL